MTNAHVVKDMGSMIVVTSTGKTYNGKMTHIDEESDLALVKIDASGLPAATFAAPSDIRAGETVVAIGTPISFALRNSVTVGIVSGIERAVQS
jgi:S1-C subfamily serine protease